MPFIHPAIFWTGLAAASIPVIIHLLNRRRFRTRDWAAMQFLLESVRRYRRRLQIEELILLLLRCLVVILLATALGRFTGCGLIDVVPAATGMRTSVYVLDDSCSMGQKIGSTTAMAIATNDLAGQLNELPESEKVAVLLTSAGVDDRPLFKLNFITDRESLVSRIQTLQPGDGRADLAAALAQAEQVLATQDGAKRLFLLSDFRRADLSGDRRKAIAGQFQKLHQQGVDVIVMDYGRAAHRNLTIKSLELVDKFVITDAPARLALTVQNHSQVAMDDVSVRVRALLPLAETDAEERFAEVDLPNELISSVQAGGQTRIEFEVTCPQPGSAAVSVALGSDDLAGDNTAHLVLDVRRQIGVVVVDGRPNIADPPESESYFFVAAADPSREAANGIGVDVVSADDIAGVKFLAYDAVVLLNVSDFPVQIGEDGAATYPQLEALEAYVREGGGLAIYTGDRINPNFYNGPLFAGGSGLSPFRVAPPRGDTSAREVYFRLDPKSIDGSSPIVRTFRGDGAMLTGLIRFFAFTATEELFVPEATPADDPDAEAPEAAGQPRVLARFTDEQHSPAIVTRRVGRGTVVMCYSTGSPRWNDWPDDQPAGIYVAPVQDLLMDIARRQKQRRSPLVGQAIALTPPTKLRDAKATLKTPTFPADPLVMLGAGETDPEGARRLSYEPTTAAGVYALSLRLPNGSGQDVLFARNVDPAEGRLDPAEKAGIEAALGSEDFAYVARASAEGIEGIGLGKKEEYWHWVMAALMVLLVTETLLARRLGHYD